MSAEEWIPIGLSCIMAIVAIITMYKNGKKDTTADAMQRAEMSANVKYIRDSIDDIKVENKTTRQELGDLKIKVTEIDQSVKSAHKRLDDYIKKGD